MMEEVEFGVLAECGGGAEEEAHFLARLRDHYRLPPDSEFLQRVYSSGDVERLRQQYQVSPSSRNTHQGKKIFYGCKNRSSYFCKFKFFAIIVSSVDEAEADEPRMVEPQGNSSSQVGGSGGIGSNDTTAKTKSVYYVFIAGEHQHDQRRDQVREELGSKDNEEEEESSLVPPLQPATSSSTYSNSRKSNNRAAAGLSYPRFVEWDRRNALGKEQSSDQWSRKRGAAQGGRAQLGSIERAASTAPSSRSSSPPLYTSRGDLRQRKKKKRTTLPYLFLTTLESNAAAVHWLLRNRAPLKKIKQSMVGVAERRQRYCCNATDRYFCPFGAYTQLRDDGRVELWERQGHDHSRKRISRSKKRRLGIGASGHNRVQSSSSSLCTRSNSSRMAMYHRLASRLSVQVETSKLLQQQPQLSSSSSATSSALGRGVPAKRTNTCVADYERDRTCRPVGMVANIAEMEAFGEEHHCAFKKTALGGWKTVYHCAIRGSTCPLRVVFMWDVAGQCYRGFAKGQHEHSSQPHGQQQLVGSSSSSSAGTCLSMGLEKERRRVKPRRDASSREEKIFNTNESDEREEESRRHTDCTRISRGNHEVFHYGSSESEDDTGVREVEDEGLAGGRSNSKAKLGTSRWENKTNLAAMPFPKSEATSSGVSGKNGKVVVEIVTGVPTPPTGGELTPKEQRMVDSIMADFVDSDEELVRTWFQVVDHEAELEQLANELQLVRSAEGHHVRSNCFRRKNLSPAASEGIGGGELEPRYVVVLDYPHWVVISYHVRDNIVHDEEVRKKEADWGECLRRIRQSLVEHFSQGRY